MNPSNKGPSNDAEPKNFKFKISFMGDGAVGKSSIISQLCNEYFIETYKSTLGCDFYTKVKLPNLLKLKVIDFTDELTVSLNIWDIGRKSMDSKLIDTYIVGSDAIVLVYDISNAESFTYLNNCLSIINKVFVGKKPYQKSLFLSNSLVALVGNKTDLYHIHTVKLDDHVKYAETNNLRPFFMSAKTGDQVVYFFDFISQVELSIRKIAAELAGLEKPGEKSNNDIKKLMKPKDEDDFGDSDEEAESKEAHKNIATKKTNKCSIF